MTDRYEQFKQYCVENHIVIYEIKSHSECYHGGNGLLKELFKGFEAKMEREEREYEIRSTIHDALDDLDTIIISNTDKSKAIYHKLKIGGYLK